MWRANGYCDVSDFASLFAYGQGMKQEIEEKLLFVEKQTMALMNAMESAVVAGRGRFYCIPTQEDVTAIDETHVQSRARKAGWYALHRFLRMTPLYLVGPSGALSVSNKIIESYEGAVMVSDAGLLLPFLTMGRFTVSAIEVVKMADAAKALNEQLEPLGLTFGDRRTLHHLSKLGDIGRSLMNYDGFVLSVKDAQVPTSRDVERLLFPDRNASSKKEGNNKGKADGLLNALDCFDARFPEGKGFTPWHEVEEVTGYSRRQIVRAFKKHNRSPDGQRLG